MKRNKIGLKLQTETVKVLSSKELSMAEGGYQDVSIIYWCPDNTSIVRSCSSCTGSGTA